MVHILTPQLILWLLFLKLFVMTNTPEVDWGFNDLHLTKVHYWNQLIFTITFWSSLFSSHAHCQVLVCDVFWFMYMDEMKWINQSIQRFYFHTLVFLSGQCVASVPSCSMLYPSFNLLRCRAKLEREGFQVNTRTHWTAAR